MLAALCIPPRCDVRGASTADDAMERRSTTQLKFDITITMLLFLLRPSMLSLCQ